jgi:hypothetical protein
MLKSNCEEGLALKGGGFLGTTSKNHRQGCLCHSEKPLLSPETMQDLGLGRDASVVRGFEDQLEYELESKMGIREGLLARGFAFALSTYSENGFAVKQGIQQTHQLRGLFKAHFGEPKRSYLMGESMGGVVPAGGDVTSSP